MRTEFPGYYRHSKRELRTLWNSAVVVPDTNVLLTLYRLGEPTREKLLAILGGLGERLFVPYQVALEFQKNRLGVIEEQKKAYDDLDKELEKLSKSVLQRLRQHPRLDKGELGQQIEAALTPIREEIASVKESHPNPLIDGHALGSDTVRDALDKALKGRVGQPRDPEQLKQVGAPRYETEQAPGWKDKEKPEPEKYGDLAIWLDAIQRAKDEDRPLILVTEERKEDWWWVDGGVLIGPCPELVEEMKEKAGQAFHLCNLAQFMQESSEALGLELSEDERDDVVRAQKVAPERERSAPGQASEWDRRRHAASFGRLPDGIQWVQEWPDGTQVPQMHFRPSSTFRLPQPRWHSGVEVEDEQAVLTVEWRPQIQVVGGMASANFLCAVTGPDGDVSEARFLASSTHARVVYPDDFEGELALEGDFEYRWFYAEDVPPSREQDRVVATGGFRMAPRPRAEPENPA
jgi:hypothetical protein